MYDVQIWRLMETSHVFKNPPSLTQSFACFLWSPSTYSSYSSWSILPIFSAGFQGILAKDVDQLIWDFSQKEGDFTGCGTRSLTRSLEGDLWRNGLGWKWLEGWSSNFEITYNIYIIISLEIRSGASGLWLGSWIHESKIKTAAPGRDLLLLSVGSYCYGAIQFLTHPRDPPIPSTPRDARPTRIGNSPSKAFWWCSRYRARVFIPCFFGA